MLMVTEWMVCVSHCSCVYQCVLSQWTVTLPTTWVSVNFHNLHLGCSHNGWNCQTTAVEHQGVYKCKELPRCEARPNLMSALVLISGPLQFSYRNSDLKDLLVGHVIPHLLSPTPLFLSISSCFAAYMSDTRVQACV